MTMRFGFPLAGIVLGAMLAIQLCAAQTDHAPDHQGEVTRRGAEVMPFDLARTTHFFDDTDQGGVETITANDTSDAGQIALIRSHLTVEAERFARGDFSDPARIHGRDMAGLAALESAGSRLHVQYAALSTGARIVYSSDDPAVITAIHQWFDAQRRDHDAHSHMSH